MLKKRFTKFLLFAIAAFVAVASACQKDPAVTNPASAKSNADSSIVSLSGNFLAASGTLKVKFKDSTYIFDAARDSIAFINVSGQQDDSRYFGITAINKEHTLSFGISSEGFAAANVSRTVAGGQFLFTGDQQNPAFQLALRKETSPVNFGSLSIEQYNNGNELAKGTFYTFLSADSNSKSPFYRVEGSFDLRLK